MKSVLASLAVNMDARSSNVNVKTEAIGFFPYTVGFGAFKPRATTIAGKK
jgi:hypothetical protein